MVWVAVGALVAALASAGVWYYITGMAPAAGYVELNASPWAEVKSVQRVGGERLQIAGETPMQMELPPGEYVIELQSGEDTGTVNVTVEAGKSQTVNYTFPQVKVESMVEEVLRQY